MLKQDIWCLMTHSDTFKMAGLCPNHVPWPTRKRNDVCLQNNTRSFFGSLRLWQNKQWWDSKLTLIFNVSTSLASHLGILCGAEREVLIRFRWGERLYMCRGVDLAGQTDEGASKSGSCLIQEGEERAGAPPYEQHLPLLVSPSAILST